MMYKILASPGSIMLISRGTQDTHNETLCFPSIDAQTSKTLYALRHSEPVSFRNLKPLSALDPNHLPVLPEGYFWYQDGSDLTIRRLMTAPRALLDLDVYSHGGDLDEPAAGYSVSQNKQLVACYANTALIDGVQQPRQEAQSTYGGYSSSKKDFKNRETQFSDTIGHAIGHKDSSSGRNKDGGAIYSDTNPRNYSPEKSHSTGGSKFGQSIRNHQLEAITRRNGGQYLEWNAYENTHEQVAVGLYVPSHKLLMRVFGGQISLALFDQNKPITDSETALVWTAHIRPNTEQPKPLILSNSSPISDEQSPLGPMFFARSNKKKVMESTDEFEIGRTMELPNGDTAIILSKEVTATGFKYEYYAFYNPLDSFIAVYAGMGTVYDQLINEDLELNDGYQKRFKPLLDEIVKLQENLDDLLILSGERKDEAFRFINSSLQSRSVSRKTDAQEISKFISTEFQSIRSHYNELKELVRSHTLQRATSLKNIIPACTDLIHELKKDGSPLQHIKDELYRGMAGISHEFKRQDRDLVNTFQSKSQHLLTAIQSLSGVLQPPKIITLS